MLCCAGYYPHLTLLFKAYGTGLILVSNQDARLKRFLLYFSKLNWNGVFTTDTSRRTSVSPKPRLRQKTTGKWQASWWEFFPVTLLSSQGEKKKKNSICGANINKPFLDKGRHEMCGNGNCAEAGDGFKPLTRELFCFQWPPWNCSRWRQGQSTDIWMTVCLLLRHNHQLSDPVKGLVKTTRSFYFISFFFWMYLKHDERNKHTFPAFQ